MTIVLFGAGASFGSGEVYPYPPPLGSGLYSELRKAYPQWASLPSDLEMKFASNFEEGMGEIISKYGMAISPLMQRMAVYFAGFSLRKNSDNLYVSLLSELKRRDKLSKTILATLNYECLLEMSAYINQIEQSYFDVRPNSANIWKIHGSCSFKFSGMNATRAVRMSGYNLQGGFTIVPDLREIISYYNGDTSLYPAMCLFAKDKPIHVSTDIILEQIRKWQQLVLNATKIIIIGVRPFEEDSHIWNFVANSDAQVVMVGSEKEFMAWCDRKRIRKRNKFLGPYWKGSEELIYAEI
jgi:hypothetical protein